MSELKGKLPRAPRKAFWPKPASRAQTDALCACALTSRATSTLAGSLCQGMHDYGPGQRRGRPDEQRRKILLDPGQRASVRLLSSRVIVEDADCCHCVVWRIDHVVSPEARDITDDRNGALFDPARQLFGHAGLCLALTNGGVHAILLFTC